MVCLKQHRWLGEAEFFSWPRKSRTRQSDVEMNSWMNRKKEAKNSGLQ